jgi:hypothetical protein
MFPLIRVLIFLAVAGPVFSVGAAPPPGNVDPSVDPGRGPNLVKAAGRTTGRGLIEFYEY